SPDRLGAFSAQAALSLGFHFVDDDRSRFFVSFASSDYSKNALSIENWGWGVLWQYDVVRASSGSSPLLSWSGIRIGTGFRWNRFQSHFSKHLGELDTTLAIPGEGSVDATVSADLDMSGDVKVMSVPLEIGTSIKWASVLSVYGVAGADAHFGNANASILVRGPVNFAATPADTDESKTASADASYSISKSESPDRFSLRGLVGLQFELGRGSVFLQYQRSSLAKSEAAALGFRTYF
ncbi:MAG: hypothetical protein ABIR96_05540, partial [Bdellovibrionota bacterium]